MRIPWDTSGQFFQFLPLSSPSSEAPVRQHLSKVYGCLAGTTAMATVGAYVYVANIFRADLLGAILAIPMVLALYMWRDNGKNFLPRMALLLGFGLVSGESLSGAFLYRRNLFD